MSLYKRRATPPIEAVQFTDPLNMPPGVQHSVIEGEFYVVSLQEKRIPVEVGEWIVTEQSAPDRHYPIADGEFQRLYEPCEGGEVRARRGQPAMSADADGRITVPAPKGPMNADMLIMLLAQTARTFKAQGNAGFAEAEIAVSGETMIVRVTLP